MNDEVIASENVIKSFAGRRVLDSLDFVVPKGQIVGLLGPNGSGKTTTVRLLNGVLAPDSGRIKVAGYDPQTRGDEIRKRSGVLTESAGLYRNLSGSENLNFFAALYDVPQPNERINKLLNDFGLDSAKDRKVGTYSTGMKKRLGIAKALLHSPEILFLDEPTTGLDPEGTRDLLEYIARLNREHGVTILLCTHLLQQVQDLCHRFIFLSNGRVLEQGGLAEIEAKYLVEIRLNVETDLVVSEDTFAGYPISERKPGHLVFRLPGKTAIPRLLQEILKQAAVYSAEVTGRDLETLYFTIRGESH